MAPVGTDDSASFACRLAGSLRSEVCFYADRTCILYSNTDHRDARVVRNGAALTKIRSRSIVDILQAGVDRLHSAEYVRASPRRQAQGARGFTGKSAGAFLGGSLGCS